MRQQHRGPPTTPLLAQPEEAGTAEEDIKKITEGKIRVLSLLRFLQDHTDKMVQYPSAAQNTEFSEEVTIDVLGDVEPLTLPIVRVLLETNGYHIFEQTLEDGSEVIQVRATASLEAALDAPLHRRRPADDHLDPGVGEAVGDLFAQGVGRGRTHAAAFRLAIRTPSRSSKH